MPETCRVTWQWNKTDCKQLHMVGDLKEYVCFGLAMFCNSCLLYDSVVAFCAYDMLDMSGVPV